MSDEPLDRSAFDTYSDPRSALVACALDCIITIDGDGHVLEFNPAAERTFGFTREEVMGEDLADLILPEDYRGAHRAGMLRFQREATSRIIGRRLHLEAVRKSGERFPVELTVTAYVNPEGKHEYTAYLRDRTESESERQRREEATSQLQEITEHLDGVIALVDWPSATLLHMSGSLGQQFQLPEDAFAKDPMAWGLFIAAEHRHLLAPLIELDPEIGEIDAEVRRAKGDSWLRIRVHPIRDGEGKATRLAVHTESITERKRVAESLEQSQFILERASEAIYLMGRDARFTYVSGGACRMLGWDREELLQMSVFQIDAKMEPGQWPAHWADLEENQTMTLESVHRRRDGSLVPVEVNANYTELNGQAYNCAVVRDISDRRAADAAVRTALDEARAAESARQAVLANLSHEVHTPLASMLGFMDLIARRPDDSGAVREWAERATASCTELREMLGNVLELQSNGSQDAPRRSTSLTLEELVNPVLSRFESRASARSIHLEHKTSGSVPKTVRLDATWLREALDKLVDNGLRYTRSGSVVVHTTASPSSLGCLLVLVVEDTGAGMDPSAIESAFGRFVRLGPNADGVDQGLGLGLPLARRRVEAMGGKLRIDSSVGKGTRAVIELNVELGDRPDWTEAAPARKPAAAVTATGSTGAMSGRVLVVEDTPALADLYRHWLEGWGLRVDLVYDGGSALAMFEANDYDLAIIDWRIPVIDGLEVVRRVREVGSFLPIIAVTAHSYEGAEETCLEAGCSAFLAKPVPPAALQGLLARYLAPAPAPPPKAAASKAPSEDKAWLTDIHKRFVESLPAELERLRAAVEMRNGDALKQHGHRLKGSAATFGFQAVADLAADLERNELSSPDLVAAAEATLEGLAKQIASARA